MHAYPVAAQKHHAYVLRFVRGIQDDAYVRFRFLFLTQDLWIPRIKRGM